ncbi:MAG TPA: hypothetical protein VES60_09770 [Nakamurella sp.]|nr:hypothetical protein [Nakamurella sp.]
MTVTMSPARRRRLDRLVAAVIAVVVVGVGVAIYLNSDVRATTSVLGPTTPAPDVPDTVPSTLTQRWSLATNPDLGSVVSPYGVVITADDHAVTGHDAVTGEVRWSYGRENLPLCAVGSGDVDAPGVTRRGMVRGVMVVSEKDGYCSQVMLLDPDTGARHYYRTSPNQVGGSLAFGGPYAAWMGPTLVELWRDDLVRTIQYGDEPNPPKPNAKHTGCTFTDIALAKDQFATVEHCPDQGGNARLVINWATPDSAPNKPDGQDVFQHDPRADIDTGSPAARIVGITADRVAVLVSSPEPAIVMYDTSGAEESRTLVEIPAEQIVAADQLAADGGTVPTPSVIDGDARYSLVGDHLIAVTSQQITTDAPATSSTTALESREPPTISVFATSTPTSESGSGSGSGSGSESELPAQVRVDDLEFAWSKDGALGLPALIGDQLLMPVDGGLAVFVTTNGNPGIVPTTIPVDRDGYTGRVDATAVGSMIIETRGGQVVGLS